MILTVIIYRSATDSSWNDGYGNSELDEFIFNEFTASSDSDDEIVEMMMMMMMMIMMSIQEELRRKRSTL